MMRGNPMPPRRHDPTVDQDHRPPSETSSSQSSGTRGDVACRWYRSGRHLADRANGKRAIDSPTNTSTSIRTDACPGSGSGHLGAFDRHPREHAASKTDADAAASRQLLRQIDGDRRVLHESVRAPHPDTLVAMRRLAVDRRPVLRLAHTNTSNWADVGVRRRTALG
jgi:hypothetical protein